MRGVQLYLDRDSLFGQSAGLALSASFIDHQLTPIPRGGARLLIEVS